MSLCTTIAWDSSLNEQSWGSVPFELSGSSNRTYKLRFWLPCIHHQVANYYVYINTGKAIPLKSRNCNFSFVQPWEWLKIRTAGI